MRACALLYSPGQHGHRSVYCLTLARALRAEGFDVVIAADLRAVDSPDGLAALARTVESGEAAVVDVSHYKDGGAAIGLTALRHLIVAHDASATFLVECDDHLAPLVAQTIPGRRPLPGRRIGIFLRTTNYQYSPEGRERERSSWGRRVAMAVDPGHVDARRFHEVMLPAGGVLDAALCLDERFVARRGAPHLWLPDMFRTAEDEEAPGISPEPEWLRHARRFVAVGAPRPLLLYLGEASERRGYRTLLRLADDAGGSFVHAGLRNDGVLDSRSGTIRAALLERGALFETDAYAFGFDAACRFLSLAECVVLPYECHLGSSGIMLQAAEAGRPVLVPDVGLMAHRVRSDRLGHTYRRGDYTDLRRQLDTLLDEGAAPYATSTARFMTFFTFERVVEAVRAALGRGAPPQMPMSAAAGGETA